MLRRNPEMANQYLQERSTKPIETWKRTHAICMHTKGGWNEVEILGIHEQNSPIHRHGTRSPRPPLWQCLATRSPNSISYYKWNWFLCSHPLPQFTKLVILVTSWIVELFLCSYLRGSSYSIPTFWGESYAERGSRKSEWLFFPLNHMNAKSNSFLSFWHLFYAIFVQI